MSDDRTRVEREQDEEIARLYRERQAISLRIRKLRTKQANRKAKATMPAGERARIQAS